MRRPTFCNNSVAVEPPRPSEKEEGRLNKVKRMFTTSLRKPVVNKVFAVPLDELPVNKDNVPKVLIKLATYIETYGMHVEGLFRLSGGSPALVEQLKAALNRSGDVDLEACSDVASVATLLKVWLRDLPDPLVTPATTAELVTTLHKYKGEPEWCTEARLTLSEIPARHSTTLECVLTLLHLYATRQPASAVNLGSVFAPLLLCAEFHGIATPETVTLTAHLIQDYSLIYSDKVTENVSLLNLKQRKRKERHNSDAASLDRKFVRSNSEERPCVEEKISSQSESIRRVSSHEDFSRTRSAQSLPNQDQSHSYTHKPLHEHNWPSPPPAPASHSLTKHTHKQRQNNNNNNANNNTSDNYENNNKLTELIESSPSPGYASDLFEDDEHERRRQSERQAHHMPPPRSRASRRNRNAKLMRCSNSDDNDGSSSKENEDDQQTSDQERESIVPSIQPASLSEDDSPVSRSTSSSSEHSSLQLFAQEKERSPSPVPPLSTPPLDLSATHQYGDEWEPLTSRDFRHPQGGDRLVSPRNSIVMTRRVFSDDAAQQPEGQINRVSKQIHSLKRKLKRFEEGFEKEFGYRPSHAEKMSNPETKKLCSLLNILRKEVKILKEDGTPSMENMGYSPSKDDGLQITHTEKEGAIHDLEKKLVEKRMLSGRPEWLEDMSREQLIEEKLAVQRGLLYLESTYGRPTSREERDTARPLYDRYRNLKRLLSRNAPSKLKDNVTELGTILEHETMDFTSSSPPPPPSSPPPAPVHSSPPSRSNTPDIENLHALPLPELLRQQQITREEKKRLRRSLREFEEASQKVIGRKLSREDRLPMEQIYTEYKHAKAKLRLLDALLMKKK